MRMLNQGNKEYINTQGMRRSKKIKIIINYLAIISNTVDDIKQKGE